MINFYSDTQTSPGRAMREAILDAPTGDERHAGCPTTNELLARVADLFGKEAAVFMPSGTMCNEVAIAVHCRPGDEIICSRESHIIFAESGGPAALSGVMMNPIDCERGIMPAEEVAAAIRPRSSFAPRSRLVVTEQTSNLGGGAVWSKNQIDDVAEVAHNQGLATHLDGARILNASVATGIKVSDYAEKYDSAWIAFTKGLGCPVGAVLVGSHSFIEEAWLLKRRWGGAMRQTGVLTAMCLYALDHNVDRLADDHALARYIGERITDADIIAKVFPVDTNIILCEINRKLASNEQVTEQLRQKGIAVTRVGKSSIRIVTHMDVGQQDADRLVSEINNFSRNL